ncbi:MAG: hypothetical protein ACPGJS_21640 [Flammeovirgaceae bacterium]
MPNVPDNEMEHFFRESANNKYDIKFNSAAWEKMEKKLDKEDRKVFWLRLGILLSCILIALVSAFFILTPNLHDKNPDNQITNTTTQEKKDTTNQGFDNEKITTEKRNEQDLAIVGDTSKQGHSTNKLNSNENKNQHSSTTKKANKGSDRAKQDDALDDQLSKGKTNADANSGELVDTSTGGDDGLSGGGIKGKVDKDNEVLEGAISDKEANKGNVAIIQGTAKKDDEGREDKLNQEIKGDSVMLENNVRALTAFPAGVIRSCEDCDLVVNIPAIAADTTAIPDPIKQIERGLFINFTLSPDLSGVGSIGTHGVRTGVKSGILLEYQPLARLSLYGGGFLARKRYLAETSEYHPPAGFWQNGDLPANVDGVCDVLEIPIGLRYSWLKKKNASFFVGGGVSSYLLLREEYVYNYHGAYDPTRRKNWIGRNQNKHWFGIALLSVGYEKKLGERSSFLFEPYVQLPFNGVGFAKVNLYSYGTYFTLKYRLR